MPVQIRACIVCEQVRPEPYEKYTLLGFFGLTPNVKVAVQDFRQPLTLCFVFMGDPIIGRVEATLRVLSPTGVALASTVPLTVAAQFPQDRALVNYFMNFQSATPLNPGIHTVTLTVNGEEAYRTAFELAVPPGGFFNH